MTNNINIELHLIQNFSPACLNRDDTNSPKDCEFGGVRRARISSQAIKRAIRDMFKADPVLPVGYRTKHLQDLLVSRVMGGQEPDEKQIEYIDSFTTEYLSKMDKKKTNQTAVLLYLGDNELDYIANLLKEGLEEGKKFKKDKKIETELAEMTKAADISLFGRMMAENPGFNVDAACQVAHAISTHRVDMDFDFFTAVDDLNPSEETGAGMMGNTGFNSACFYRYSLINWKQLQENLAGDRKLSIDVIKNFMEASIKAIPTGKQNSFAAQNPPMFGLFVVRKNGTPCSLANAFVKPVYPRQDADLVANSVAELATFHNNFKKVYGDGDIVCEALFHLTDGKNLGELAQADCGSVKAAIETSLKALTTALED